MQPGLRENGRLGAAEVTGAGVVAALCALFELVWQHANLFDAFSY